MKRLFSKSVVFVLVLVMVLTMFSACSSEDPATPASAQLETVVTPTTVVIHADGQEITVENANGKTFRQLLEQANIVLSEDDMLFVDPDQVLPDQLTLQVRRKCFVSVMVDMEDPQEDASYTAVLIGGTVADALASLDLEIAENQLVNFELDKSLENNMAIVITQAPEEEPEETEPEETEPEETEPSYSDSDDSDYTPEPTQPAPTTPAPTTPAPTTPAPTEPKPTEPAPTEPAPTEPERYVVSVQEYLDCDGSGHGVRVITYSDGTQVEEYF